MNLLGHFNIHETCMDGSDSASLMALIATLVNKYGGSIQITPGDMEEALGNKELILTRSEDDEPLSVTLRLEGYSSSEKN